MTVQKQETARPELAMPQRPERTTTWPTTNPSPCLAASSRRAVGILRLSRQPGVIRMIVPELRLGRSMHPPGTAREMRVPGLARPILPRIKSGAGFS